MTTRRTSVWLLVFLLTLPVVVAAADTTQRVSDAEVIVRTGDLHEGERFVYDLTFHSKLHQVTSTATGYLTIEVGAVQPMRLADGTVADVLPVTTLNTDAPWHTMRGERDHTERTVYLRVPDGVPIYSEEDHHRVRVQRSTDDYTVTEESGRAESFATNDWGGSVSTSHLFASYWPGQEFLNGNLVTQMLFSFAGMGHRDIRGTGDWKEEIVYLVDERDNEEVRDSPAFACFIRTPNLQYQDWEGRERFSEGPFDTVRRDQVWVLPNVAFPVVSACQSTYAQGGEVLESIEITLALQTHVQGGAKVPITRQRGEVPEPVRLPVRPVLLPGLPAQGDIDLRFSVEEAVTVLMTHPDLAGFRDDGPIPFHVTSFDHRPKEHRRADTFAPDLGAPGVPDPLGLLPPAVIEEGYAGESTWRFAIENSAGEGRDVMIERAYGDRGSVLDEEVKIDEGWSSAMVNDQRFVAADHPHEVVTIAEILKEWARAEGRTIGSWKEERGSLAITNIFGVSDQQRFITPIYRIGTNQATEDGGGIHLDRQFQAVDGLPTSRSERQALTYTTEARPSGSPAMALQAETVSVQAYVPVAAAASGFAVFVVFAAAYFSDTLARFVGHAFMAPMYAKIRKDKVLDHTTRDVIVDYVTANPGAPLGAVRRHIGSGYGTAVHHLNTLVRNRLLVSRKVGRERCYFPYGSLSPGEMDAVAIGATDAAGRFLEVVANEPGLTQQEVADRLGITDASVRYQAKRLLEHARVRAVREGRTVRYYPDEVVAAV